MPKSIDWNKIPRELLRKQLEYTSFIEFGKFTLQRLKLENVPEHIDWFDIFEAFIRLNSNSGVKPGLMYLNWVVSTEFNKNPIEVRYNKTKKPEFTLPKHITIYLSYEMFNGSVKDISEFYKIKRSSVATFSRRTKELLSVDKKLNTKVEKIIKRLLGYSK